MDSEQTRKRKRGASATRSSKKKQICVVHFPDSNCESFLSFSDTKDPKERLKKLLDIREKRLGQPIGSVHRMEDVCGLIPAQHTEEHGYHRDCYQRFTMNLSRLKPLQQSSQPSCAPRTTRRSSSDSDKVIFLPDCIFCNKEGRKKVKEKGLWTTEGTSNFEYDGWKRVLELAENRKDDRLLIRIRGYDLFACEAQYHKSCRAKYVQDPIQWRSADTEERQKQQKLAEAHLEAFSEVCKVIDKDIIARKQVLKLNDLCQLYISSLAKTEFPNPKYRGEKLKAKLEKNEKYKNNLSFCRLDQKGKFQSYLVYSSEIDIGSAVKCAYELGSADMIQEVATYLRKQILEAFENSSSLPWPPTAQYLGNMEGIIPTHLEKFLNYVFSGKETGQSSKMQRLVYSIGQDICRAVTNGQWKLPKHVLICMTMRHLFRSAELTTLLNRFGHCENYSFSLELETALANALQQTSYLLTTQIMRNPVVPTVFHSEFDNFDQLLNDLTGMGSIHTAHGIMMQDFETTHRDCGGTYPEVPSVARTKERSLNLTTTDNLPECYVTRRHSPHLNIAQQSCPSGTEVEMTTAKNILWILIRKQSSTVEQQVPSWTGFISVTGVKPSVLTTIDYYPVIAHPITDYKTVQECLRYAEEATTELGQQYVITTFDLGVCMKAYPLIWNDPIKYKRHIVLIGTFHLACAYFKMLGKKMNGSGLSDVLLEAGLIGTGSLNGVLSGKHYDRAMHCHKLLLESLERLLLEQFISQKGEDHLLSGLPEETVMSLNNFTQSPNEETLELLMADEQLKKNINDYIQYRNHVRTGLLGKTAQFWMSYMDHVWLVLELIESVKTNNYGLYTHCMHVMPDLFFSFHGQNYARYLTYFSTFLANIEHSHPGATELLKRGAISVARSFIPGNRCAVDKTMEETFMKHAKSHGGAGGTGAGLSGILSNYDSYQRWVRTTHTRSQFVNATLHMADMLTESSDGQQHRDLRPVEIRKSEKCVAKTIDAITSFTNPFTVEDQGRLYSISSGAPVPPDIQNDVLRAESAGKKAKEEFIKDRLEKNDNFFEPVKRIKLKTMGDMNKTVKVKAGQNKVVSYKQQGNIAFQLLVKSQSEGLQLDLKEMMTYPLTPVPHSIGTADGFLAKTNKAKGFEYLTKEIEDAAAPQDETTLVIQDGNAVFYYMKEIPGNFRQISCKVLDMVTKKSDVVFSTDMYRRDSVKSMERQRRGCGEKLIVKGDSTKKPKDWKTFLSNDENKKQFIQMLHDVWSKNDNASKFKGREVILICEGVAYQLTSQDGRLTETSEIESLRSTQEETDSRVILYCMYAEEKGYDYIRVKSPDSDIFFILLHYALTLNKSTIIFDTGTGNKKRLLNISEIARGYTQQHCTALMALHAFTGCDSTSAFKGMGKLKPIKTLQKMPRFVPVLASLGDSWDVNEELLGNLEEFTCTMYGGPRYRHVNEFRHRKIKEKCNTEESRVNPTRNVDLGALPPCQKALEQHIRRVNYQVGIWKKAHIADPDIPNPTDGNGWQFIDGKLEPLWIDGEVLPIRMVDILQDTLAADSSDEEDSVEYHHQLSDELELLDEESSDDE